MRNLRVLFSPSICLLFLVFGSLRAQEAVAVRPCAEICQRAFDEALDRCSGDRRGVSDRCRAAAEEARRRCRNECDEDRPSQPTCLDLCERRVDFTLENCKRDGLSHEDCEAKALEVREHCHKLCNRPPPESAPGCKERCTALAESAEARCEDPESEECAKRVRMVLESCAQRCESDEAPPPQTCPERCERSFHNVLRRCTNDDGLISEECQQRAAAARDACVETCREPPTCEAICRGRVTEYVETCVKEGNDADECKQRGRMILDDCVDRCPRDDPPRPRPTCASRCSEAARRQAERCVEAGNDPEKCRSGARRFQQQCMEGCEDVGPRPCLERCKDRVDKSLKDCLSDATGDEAVEECRVQARENFGVCQRSCDPQPVPCKGRCERKAEEALEQCLEKGPATIDVDGPARNVDVDAIGPEEVCNARARRVFHACVTENCEPSAPLPPPTCEDRCKRHIKALIAQCLEDGGTREECYKDSRPEYEKCLLRCEDQPPPGCAERCREASEKVLKRCKHSHPEACERCVRSARRLFTSCRQRCERPDPPSCDERCALVARDVAEQCEDADDPAACKERVRDAVNACVEGCKPRPRPTCEESCTNRAKHLFEHCQERGGSEDECAEVARTFNERCEHNCEVGPAPPCLERCNHIARRFFANCVDEEDHDGDTGNGAEESADGAEVDGDSQRSECRKQANAVLRRCSVRCADRDRSCEDGCGKRARDVRHRCLESLEDEIAECIDGGGDPESCKARAIAHCDSQSADFLARCIRANCQRPEPLPQPCPERCDEVVAAFVDECESNGGENCGEQSDALRERCLNRCGRDDIPDCDVDCAELATRVKERCDASDSTEDECKKLVVAFTDRCKANLTELCKDDHDEHTRAPIVFQRGDVNHDGVWNIGDPVALLRGLFLGESAYLACLDAADMNDDGRVDLSDSVFGLLEQFVGGRPVPDPGPRGRKGHDPTADDLLCFPR